MCDLGLIGYERTSPERNREAAKRRFELANKCDSLKAIDRSIKEGGAIYDCLIRCLPEVEMSNAGAADTIKSLLRQEGWKG